MVWPDPVELRKFVDKGYGHSIILQVSKDSMEQCGNNPIVVAERISREYGGLISHVLLDCSMGKGVEIDINLIYPYVEAIKSHTSDIRIAVAGGLGPGSVQIVKPLVEQYCVSIDAQSKLRRSGSSKDPIDWDLAKQYVEDAIRLY